MKDFDLTRDELRRFLKRMRTKYASYGVHSVAFGYAEKHGKRDKRRGFCLVFIVNKKRKLHAVSVDSLLPKSETIYLIRESKRIRRSIPTDIIAVSRMPRVSGFRTRRFTDHVPVTSGILIRWLSPHNIDQWGFMTVGHLFEGDSIGTGSEKAVLVRMDDGSLILGQVMFISPKSSKYDVSVIRVNSNELAPFGLTKDDGRVIRTFFDLRRDGGKEARMRPMDDDSVKFNFASGLYMAELESRERTWIDILVGDGSNYTFNGGRSGSVWTIRGDIAGLQVARLAPTNERGYAHVFEFLWQYTIKSLEERSIAAAGTCSIVRIV